MHPDVGFRKTSFIYIYMKTVILRPAVMGTPAYMAYIIWEIRYFQTSISLRLLGVR